MNERIQELAIRVVGPSRLHGGEFALFGNKDVEKFAELIIQECVDICMKKYDTGLLMAPQSPWIANQIKEHFGVE